MNIEIGKSRIKGKYNIRIGDIEGSSEHLNLTPLEIVSDFCDAFEDFIGEED